jgi:hypothetical protein
MIETVVTFNYFISDCLEDYTSFTRTRIRIRIRLMLVIVFIRWLLSYDRSPNIFIPRQHVAMQIVTFVLSS